MAEAVQIPEDAVQASALVTADVVVLGGEAMTRQQSSRRQQQQQQQNLTDLVPMAPPPSVPTLLKDLASCINGYELVAHRAEDPQWIRLFRGMSSNDYGDAIASVQSAFDQPRVALLLAPHLNGGSGIRCADAAAAVRAASAQHRAVMAQRLLPLCTDAHANHGSVRDELSDWERTVAHRALENAEAAAAVAAR